MNKNFDELLNGGDVNTFVKNNLSKEQTERLENILNDKNKINELLSSPKAQELIKKLGHK